MSDSILPKDFYVYLHRKATTGEVFYVGKGQGKRLYGYSARNRHWHHVANKHGFTAHIVEDGLQEWAAFELERDLIALYGRQDVGMGRLVNYTDGGEGSSGTVQSEETRQKKIAMRLGKAIPDDIKLRIAESNRRTKSNPEVKQKARDRIMGDKNPMFGTKWSQEMREKILAARIGQKKTARQVKVREIDMIFRCEKDAVAHMNALGVKVSRASALASMKHGRPVCGYTFIGLNRENFTA
jgi:hypothetical protein